MGDYIKEAINTFDQHSHINLSTNTPALQNLFMVDTTSPRLESKRSEEFHHCVAKLFYVSKRCRLDILIAVSFLCTRLTCSTEARKANRRIVSYGFLALTPVFFNFRKILRASQTSHIAHKVSKWLLWI